MKTGAIRSFPGSEAIYSRFSHRENASGPAINCLIFGLFSSGTAFEEVSSGDRRPRLTPEVVPECVFVDPVWMRRSRTLRLLFALCRAEETHLSQRAVHSEREPAYVPDAAWDDDFLKSSLDETPPAEVGERQTLAPAEGKGADIFDAWGQHQPLDVGVCETVIFRCLDIAAESGGRQSS